MRSQRLVELSTISNGSTPSSEVAERAYELIHTERDGSLTEGERKELESYLVIEYLMELVKLEAQRQLRQQAS
jgi:hypothetical protein